MAQHQAPHAPASAGGVPGVQFCGTLHKLNSVYSMLSASWHQRYFTVEARLTAGASYVAYCLAYYSDERKAQSQREERDHVLLTDIISVARGNIDLWTSPYSMLEAPLKKELRMYGELVLAVTTKARTFFLRAMNREELALWTAALQTFAGLPVEPPWEGRQALPPVPEPVLRARAVRPSAAAPAVEVEIAEGPARVEGVPSPLTLPMLPPGPEAAAPSGAGAGGAEAGAAAAPAIGAGASAAAAAAAVLVLEPEPPQLAPPPPQQQQPQLGASALAAAAPAPGPATAAPPQTAAPEAPRPADAAAGRPRVRSFVADSGKQEEGKEGGSEGERGAARKGAREEAGTPLPTAPGPAGAFAAPKATATHLPQQGADAARPSARPKERLVEEEPLDSASARAPAAAAPTQPALRASLAASLAGPSNSASATSWGKQSSIEAVLARAGAAGGLPRASAPALAGAARPQPRRGSILDESDEEDAGGGTMQRWRGAPAAAQCWGAGGTLQPPGCARPACWMRRRASARRWVAGLVRAAQQQQQ